MTGSLLYAGRVASMAAWRSANTGTGAAASSSGHTVCCKQIAVRSWRSYH